MPAKDTVKKMVDAFNRHEANAFAALFAPDAVAYDPQYPQPLKGREAIRKDIEDFFQAFPDIQFKISNIIVSGDTVAFEGSAIGTHKGPLAGPTGTVPATNRGVEIRFAAFDRVNAQDLVVEERRYFDLAGMMQQLGLMPGS